MHGHRRCSKMQRDRLTNLRNPEPDPLEDVSWNLLWPLAVLGIESGFTSRDVGVSRVDERSPLENFPECVEDEEDRNAQIGSEEIGDGPVRVVFANKDIKSIEDDNDGEVGEGKPGSVWLEPGLENKSVAVNPLSFECLVELYVCNANRAPGEEGCNSGQVLEPVERSCSTTVGIDGEIGEASNNGCEEDTPVWDTSFAAAEEEFWCLSVLCKSEHVTRSGVQESVSRRGGGSQDDSVDDGWEDWNTSILDANNPW